MGSAGRVALDMPATINLLNAAASSGSSFFAAGLASETGAVAFDCGSAHPPTRPIQHASLFLFPLGPMTSRLSFSADPQLFVILPNATNTSPFVSIPPLPVPLSLEISSLVSDDSSSLPSAPLDDESTAAHSLETDGKSGFG